jgi:LPS O-antigen subunit length determinant protein (WzzB/FepE family)
MENNNQENSNDLNNFEEINIREILSVLKRYLPAQLIIISIFALSSIGYSLIVSEKWTSSAIVVPVSSSSGIGQISSAQGGLAALTGVNFSSKAPDASLIISSLKSRMFFESLIGYEGVLDHIMAFESFDHDKKSSSFKKIGIERKDLIDNTPLSFQKAHMKYLSMLSATSPPRSGMIYMEVSHGSPIFARDFLELIIKEFNSAERKKDIQESEEALDYLYNQLGVVKDSAVQLSISQLIESELKKLTFANVRINYAIDPLDVPYVPELRSFPKRKQIVLTFTFIGFIISIIGVLGFYYFRKALNKI